MKIINELVEMIDDELEGAEEYAKQALLLHDTHPDIAKVYYEISTEEMRHVDMLHTCVKSQIEKQRKEHGEPPPAMMAIYEYTHKRHIEEAAEIRGYQAQYREHM